MSDNFFDAMITKHCGEFTGEILLFNNDVKGDIVKELREYLRNRLKSSIAYADGTAKDPYDRLRYSELIRQGTCVRLTELEDFWFKHVKGYIYESITEQMMRKKTFDAYSQSGKLVKKCLRAVELQIAIFKNIQDLYDDLMKETPDYKVTIREAIITAVTKGDFMERHAIETRNNRGMDLKATLEEYLSVYSSRKDTLESVIDHQKQFDENTVINTLKSAIDIAHRVSTSMKTLVENTDLNIFSESLSYLFKLKWEEVSKLSTIQKASNELENIFSTKELEATRKDISQYLETYNDRSFYNRAKAKIVSAEMVNLINNRINCYY
jgi:hypothetical protein